MQKKHPELKIFDASEYRIGIVVCMFNGNITQSMLKHALKTLKNYNVNKKNTSIVYVAGSVEIPLMLQYLAKEKKFDCLVALGAVIKGETVHCNYVAKMVSEGIMHVMLEQHVPIGFGIVTTDNVEQAKARISAGGQATAAALHSARLIKQNKFLN